jgi:hypothetical protein
MNLYIGHTASVTKDATVCVNGATYNLVHGWPREHKCIAPADAEHIPWHTRPTIITTTEHDTRRLAIAMTLRFPVVWRFPAEQIVTDSVHLERSRRNDKVSAICTQRRGLVFAFAMGAHPRLGSGSAVRMLDHEMLRLVAQFV